MALRELEKETGFNIAVLRKAAQQGRLDAEKRGHFWFSTPAAVERAIESGRLRRK